MQRFIPRFALLLSIGIAAMYGWQRYSTPAAPAVEFTTLTGKTVRLAELRGHPVLVSFWATSCESCWQELPDLVKLHRDYAARGFQLIAVAMEYDEPAKVAELARAKRLPYTVVHDAQGRLAGAFDRVELIPASFLIAPDGRIVLRHAGPVHAEELRAPIERLLEET